MPAAAIVAGSVVGAGASIYGANKASKAAGKAADQNAAVQREAYQQTRQDLAPYAGAGNVATQALLQRLGLSTGPAPSANYATPQGGGLQPAAAGNAPQVDYAAYVQGNPDLMALWQGQQGMAKGKSLEDFGQFHWENYAQPLGEDRPFAPVAPVQQAQPQVLPASYGPQAQTGPEVAVRPAFERPQFGEQEPTFGPAPNTDDYLDPSKFTTSPGYEFRLNEGTRNLNAKYGARGLLKSGAAIQGITDYGQGRASEEYGNWFNQGLQRYSADAAQYNADRAVGLGQYNLGRNIFNQNFETDRARGDNIYDTDRAYDTNRYDAYTGNLFNLAGMGQSAAAGQAGAGQNYAAAATANNNARASVQGNAAIAGANGINSAINSGLQAYGMYANPFGGARATGGWTGFAF
ncbi:MAG TPA: hypothetical protein VJ775_05940 [Sphingomicrobium sp.]|nr:hypothetical protein [Sphingomicrobium sp.]